MKPIIQDIVISTNQNARLTISITQASQGAFTNEINLNDPQLNIPHFPLNIGGNYPSGSDAFEAAVSWVDGWLRTHGQTTTRIVNPCNCEYVLSPVQQAIVAKYGITTLIEVNP